MTRLQNSIHSKYDATDKSIYFRRNKILSIIKSGFMGSELFFFLSRFSNFSIISMYGSPKLSSTEPSHSTVLTAITPPILLQWKTFSSSCPTPSPRVLNSTHSGLLGDLTPVSTFTQSQPFPSSLVAISLQHLNMLKYLPLKTKHSGLESPPPRLYRVWSSAIIAPTFYCNSLLCRESIHCTLCSVRVRLLFCSLLCLVQWNGT